MNLICKLAVLACTFFIIHISVAEGQEYYIENLIEKSRALKLAEDPQWLALLHYERRTLLPSYISMARSELFFNAADGRFNPQSELEATIRNFFKTNGREADESREPYQCAFKARFAWLDEKLNFDRAKLPQQKCLRFDEWISAINAESVTLVFPAAFINNPASAFGHTLLRLDQPNQNEKTRLLAYTANYSASTFGEGGFVYALKGVLGEYPGFFSVGPYYEKVKKYSDMERRDIWEYRLNFSRSEVKFMLMHLWELRSVAFSYYYFDENCSYYLLRLLDVVRPSLQLARSSRAWVIPVDTVRSQLEKIGVVDEANFRPSAVTRLQARIAATSKEAREVAKNLTQGKVSSEDPAVKSKDQKTQAEATDLAYDYLNYKIMSGGDEELQKRAFALLKARSNLPATAAPSVTRPKVRPDQGHSTSRLGVASGLQRGKWYYDLRMRGAYHDLLDPAAGFVKGAQIELFDTVLRQQEEQGLKLERAMIVDIKSLSARNEFLKPVSWNLDAGFQRRNMPGDKRALTFSVNAGAGLSWKLDEYVFSYTLFDISSLFSQRLDDSYALGMGPKAGFLISAADWWQIGPQVSLDEYLLGDDHSVRRASIVQTFALGQNKALRLGASRSRSFAKDDSEIYLAFDYYL